MFGFQRNKKSKKSTKNTQAENKIKSDLEEFEVPTEWFFENVTGFQEMT